MGAQVVHALIIPWLIACALCNITIATTLTLYLNTCRTGFMRTETIVNRLIGTSPSVVVANGLLTASFTILHLSTFLSLEPESFQTDSMKVKDSGQNLIAVQRPSCQPVEVTIREETHEMVDSNPHLKASEWRDLSSAADNLEKLNTECTWV
ncbi:hypothetical protein PHLGIDRAFT_120175 [Phlebiopsis gigantea 11061_1 CR5-6]|uniref:Uncharacterized protein n=1 Tax=Phlebiopsis gigantea (strain 11061_1 CR5-6) TaxID=745531 RepID=A0A0C3S844_PHLG1|nr:hypothetical protein PHLGIDRAFT_120175 [Phlebiopsis gigantea 11061_1 CR5-6]